MEGCPGTSPGTVTCTWAGGPDLCTLPSFHCAHDEAEWQGPFPCEQLPYPSNPSALILRGNHPQAPFASENVPASPSLPAEQVFLLREAPSPLVLWSPCCAFPTRGLTVASTLMDHPCPPPRSKTLGQLCILFILLPCLVSYRRTSSNRKCLFSSALGRGQGD